MIHPSPTRSSERGSEAGYTLAALIVIMTVLAVVVAYTVPDSWSIILRRERDLQTQFAMKQYARAITEFQRRNGALPVSLEQLEKQTMPTVLRRTYANPLSGEMDWILVPPGEARQPNVPGQPAIPGQQQPIVNPQQTQPGQPQPSQGTPGSAFPNTAGGSAGYTGPFVGVRPPQTGEAVVPLGERTLYEEWMYTIIDLQQEMSGGVPGNPGGAIVNPQQTQPVPSPSP